MECINLVYPFDDDLSMASSKLFESIIQKPILIKEDVSAFYSTEIKDFIYNCLERDTMILVS